MNRLPIPFWFGCVLLLCVSVAIFSNFVGYAAAQQNQQQASTSTKEVTKVTNVTQCVHCAEADGLITQLRQQLIEARQEILSARQKRIEARAYCDNDAHVHIQKETSCAVSDAGTQYSRHEREYEHELTTSTVSKSGCKDCQRPGLFKLFRRN